MTYVEFFERDVLENLCTCLAMAPDKVILIGDSRKLMSSHADRYERLLRARREVVEFEIVSVDRYNIANILNVLDRIIREEPDCVFDLTGGSDLCLVAIGILSERYKDRHLQMHRFNLRNNTVFDCDLDGKVTVEGAAPQIRVEEMVYAGGGEVVFEEDYPCGTHLWDWTDEFERQVRTMWEICRRNTRVWNLQTWMLASIETFNLDPENELTTSVSRSVLDAHLEEQGRKLYVNHRMMRSLVRAGLITLFDLTDENLTVTYCSPQVKRCLTVGGRILELYVYALAQAAREPDRSPTYHDVMTGVVIDWDGQYGSDNPAPDTTNEVDLILMHGMTPVFISCKNGDVDNEELYKFNAVAERFGGKYAKKILIATSLDLGDVSVQYLLRRADELNIQVVTGLQNLDEAAALQTVRNLWKLQNDRSQWIKRPPL